MVSAWTSRGGLVAVLALGGCYGGADDPFPEPDYEFFEARVFPVLLRDCGFTECHASPNRFFTVYAPGRLRLDPEAQDLFDDLVAEEVEATYDHARAMLVTADDDIRTAPLLRKPREGAGHAGLDVDGNNVYGSHEDPGYATLVQWATGETL